MMLARDKATPVAYRLLYNSQMDSTSKLDLIVHLNVKFLLSKSLSNIKRNFFNVSGLLVDSAKSFKDFSYLVL